MIPGIISTALESWGTHEKSRKFFRSRLWGGYPMIRFLALDKNGWLEHMKLNPKTGLDPDNIKIRAAEGLTSADYLFTGYWVWAKVIENLSAIGYDTHNMHLASYDWRLTLPNLEIRDGYFTRLKGLIEQNKRITGRKSVIVTHSMGSNVFYYFLKWVEHEQGGNGGDQWVENHIEHFANIAGPMLGVPKAMTFLLSGETSDTMAFGSFGVSVLEKFFCRRERTDLLRTWGGASMLLQKGSDAVWGSATEAPEDDDAHSDVHSYGKLISFVPTARKAPDDGDHAAKDFNASTEIDNDTARDSSLRNQTTDMTMQLLRSSASADFGHMLDHSYSFGLTTDKDTLAANDNNPRAWSNALESRLPNAPSMKIHCMYGVGLPTERSYYYASVSSAKDPANDTCDVFTETFNDSGGRQLMSLAIDPSVSDAIYGIETGIRTTDGDKTVPVLSNGYMCAPSGGWRKHAELYNPSNISVITKEYKHVPPSSAVSVRGGPATADHVDILGNHELLLDILQIVSNRGDQVQGRIHSDIERYAQRIKL
ncbi:Lecithin:cholesterol/phospholipid:diacylglycerol acyltransferase [Gongronella butleri]|nr:Lecithin:cholesterol/phospholipid:diacylglycerol acyltransferase [Gongronella butleri]